MPRGCGAACWPGPVTQPSRTTPWRRRSQGPAPRSSSPPARALDLANGLPGGRGLAEGSPTPHRAERRTQLCARRGPRRTGPGARHPPGRPAGRRRPPLLRRSPGARGRRGPEHDDRGRQGPSIAWDTGCVRLAADAIRILVGGAVLTVRGDLALHSDPGDESCRTLEAVWQESGTEQRVSVYLEADADDWWVSELRTYDGRPVPDRITYPGRSSDAAGRGVRRRRAPERWLGRCPGPRRVDRDDAERARFRAGLGARDVHVPCRWRGIRSRQHTCRGADDVAAPGRVARPELRVRGAHGAGPRGGSSHHPHPPERRGVG